MSSISAILFADFILFHSNKDTVLPYPFGERKGTAIAFTVPFH